MAAGIRRTNCNAVRSERRRCRSRDKIGLRSARSYGQNSGVFPFCTRGVSRCQGLNSMHDGSTSAPRQDLSRRRRPVSIKRAPDNAAPEAAPHFKPNGACASDPAARPRGGESTSAQRDQALRKPLGGADPKISIAEEARSILARLGVPAGAFAAGGLTALSPITGETIATLKVATAAEAAEAAIGRAHGGLPAWRKVPAPRRGEFVRLLGEELRAREGRPRPAGHARGRQDRLRGPRRGAGDDRHLRLRRRPVAPALRPDHRHRARRPPDDGDLASARRRRRHLGLQLPGRGLVVERGARLRLRRHAWSGSRRRRRR